SSMRPVAGLPSPPSLPAIALACSTILRAIARASSLRRSLRYARSSSAYASSSSTVTPGSCAFASVHPGATRAAARRRPRASADHSSSLSGMRLAHRQAPVRPNVVAGVAVRIFLQVVLVLRLGLPERSRGSDLGDDLARPEARRLDVGDRVLGDLLLLVAREVDRRAVARAAVVALAVLRRRVVDLEKELEQLPVRETLRVEDDLDRLGVRAVVAVRRVRDVAAAVADAR